VKERILKLAGTGLLDFSVTVALRAQRGRNISPLTLCCISSLA